MQEIKQDLEDLTKIVSNMMLIIKNLEARISKLEGRLICPNCNGLIELKDKEKDNLETEKKTHHDCKYCNRIISITDNSKGLLEVKLMPEYKMSLSEEICDLPKENKE